MDVCLTPSEMEYFLSLTGLEYILRDALLTVKAATRDVVYVFNGFSFCYSGGTAT